MSLVIRFSKIGRRGERKYRVVVKEKRSKRDGKALEILGHYEKTVKGVNRKFNKERIDYWVSKGAIVSDAVKGAI